MQGGDLLYFVVHAKGKKILLGVHVIPTDNASTQHIQKYCGLQYMHGFYVLSYKVEAPCIN